MTEKEKQEQELKMREHQASSMLQAIAYDIQNKLPKGFGFTLLAYEFGDAEGRKMLYVSNGNREDCQRAMKEFCDKIGDNEYGKDVE